MWSGYIHKKRAVQRITLLTAFTSCSGSFSTDLQSKCMLGGMGEVSLFNIKNSNAFRLQYSAKDSIILFNLMYGSSMYNRLVLDRKKIVFEHFLKLRNKLRP